MARVGLPRVGLRRRGANGRSVSSSRVSSGAVSSGGFSEEAHSSHAVPVNASVGVFAPCLHDALGVIILLRLPWIIGHAGVGYSLLIVLLSCTTSSLTALSLAAIAANDPTAAHGASRGSGRDYGPHDLFSHSLGPEFGGSIALIFYLSRSVGAAMHALGAAEIAFVHFWPALALSGGCGGSDPPPSAFEARCTGCDRWDISLGGVLVLIASGVGVLSCGSRRMRRAGPYLPYYLPYYLPCYLP